MPAKREIVLVLSLLVLFGGAFAVTAVAAPGTSQPSPPSSTCGIPTPFPDCAPPSTTPGNGVPLPIPTATTSPSASPPECTGVGCIPQPPTSVPPSGNPDSGPSTNDGDAEGDCGFTNIVGCVNNAINTFFRGIITDALNPLLDLLAKTLLSTPTPDAVPGIGALWNGSWQILLAIYGLLVVVAGVLVMAYETVQNRYSVKEILPRLVVGFLAGALSLWVATNGIQLANALSQAVMGGGLDASEASDTLKNMVVSSLGNLSFMAVIGLVVVGLLLVLLVTYIVRVALMLILIAGAPLALMCHALPQTEGIAKWWWKAYGGLLAIQVGQSLTLVTAMKVFLAPGGFSIYGATPSGLVNMLVTIALLYVLFKIPFWILGSIRGGGGRSFVGSLARGFLAYKTFGLLGGGKSGGSRSRSMHAPKPADPYARTRTTRDGQYILPLPGLRRVRPAPKPKAMPTASPSRAQGRQLALPLGDDWPENKPILGQDGQYRLPLNVDRVKPHHPPVPPPARGGSPGGKQLKFEFDPYQASRRNSAGQYALPLDLQRSRPRPTPPSPAPRRGSGPRGTQLELPFDPYQGNRPTRSGQYPLPLGDLGRQPRTPAAPPPAAPRPRANDRRQLRLPLDLPKRPRPRKPSSTSSSLES